MLVYLERRREESAQLSMSRSCPYHGVRTKANIENHAHINVDAGNLVYSHIVHNSTQDGVLRTCV